MEKGGTRRVVRSPNALSVHTAGTGGKRAVAPQGGFSEACFLFPHLPCFLFPRSAGFLSLMGCSFLQRAQDRGWWGREADAGDLFRCSNYRMPCLTLCAPLSFSISYEERHG